VGDVYRIWVTKESGVRRAFSAAIAAWVQDMDGFYRNCGEQVLQLLGQQPDLPHRRPIANSSEKGKRRQQPHASDNLCCRAFAGAKCTLADKAGLQLIAPKILHLHLQDVTINIYLRVKRFQERIIKRS